MFNKASAYSFHSPGRGARAVQHAQLVLHLFVKGTLQLNRAVHELFYQRLEAPRPLVIGYAELGVPGPVLALGIRLLLLQTPGLQTLGLVRLSVAGACGRARATVRATRWPGVALSPRLCRG